MEKHSLLTLRERIEIEKALRDRAIPITFPVILTDRGSEFTDPMSIYNSASGRRSQPKEELI